VSKTRHGQAARANEQQQARLAAAGTHPRNRPENRAAIRRVHESAVRQAAEDQAEVDSLRAIMAGAIARRREGETDA
jgi:hypothetical protein